MAQIAGSAGPCPSFQRFGNDVALSCSILQQRLGHADWSDDCSSAAETRPWASLGMETLVELLLALAVLLA